MKVVRIWLSCSRGHWWYPFMASSFVKILAFWAAISATACAGVADLYLPFHKFVQLGKIDTHSYLVWVLFWSDDNGKTRVSEFRYKAMIPCSCSSSNSAFGLSRKENRTILGAFTQNGWSFLVNMMQNFSTSLILICPSKTVGNSWRILGGDDGWLMVVAASLGFVVGAGFR